LYLWFIITAFAMISGPVKCAGKFTNENTFILNNSCSINIHL